MEKKDFLKTIQSCRRRLNMADFLKKSVFALSIGAGVGILFQALAFITPLYYVNLYTVLAFIFAELAVLVVFFIKRTTMKQAALVMDRFGFAERIVTAYEHLEQEGNLVELQRKDAMEQLHAHKDRIQIPLLPSWKKIVLFVGLSVLLTGLALMPSLTKDRARELHNIKEEAREKEEEIEEILEALGDLEQEELTPEQQAALQEMTESLQSSLSEYQQAASQEMMTAASERLQYKYGNISSQMSDMLQSGAAFSAATIDSMQAMSDKLREMSGEQLAMNDSSGSQQGQNSNGQNGQNSQGSNGQNSNGNSQNGNGQNSNGNSQNGQGSNGQNGNGNSQNGQGSNGQNGNGQNGAGGNGGSGNGRGTGSSSTSHDYVSVPNAIVDSGSLTGNATNHDNSEFFRAQNGISWEGEHIPYDAVIGSYEQNAYEGIAAGRYPSGMEEVIKEYFSSF